MLVVDASVAVKWVIAEDGAAAAAELRSQRLMAPDIWLAECANALWKRARRGEFEAALAAEAIAELLEAPVTTIPLASLACDALAIALEIGHPVYDCFYLALAQSERTQMVTSDSRLVSKVASTRHADRVVMLGAGPTPA